MSDERLIYMPLGGAGEIGMNAYVYGWGRPGRERLILVDLGVTFPDMDGTPGVSLIMADIDWVLRNKDRLEAIFVTHAHEDHVGAVALNWERLGVPVYARTFTSEIARRKFEDLAVPADPVHTVDKWPETVAAGPFRVGFLPVAHSIPESSALVIDTPAGRVVHTGDFKLDETPLVGEPFDEAAWRAVAEPGLKALVVDSTNVFEPRPGRSEALLGPHIEELVANATGRVAATTFASNVARVRTLAEAGLRAGRQVALLGRAMNQMVDAALKTGVLDDFPPLVTAEQAAALPRHKVMLIVTGSQGERRAATAQLAQGVYRGLELTEGDTMLFSSKTIPGNEKAVIRLMNLFSEKGVDVVDDANGYYHVSGHANRPDLERVHEILDPQMVIPMHGEHRHLREHAKLAESLGRPSVIAPNGTMVDLTGDKPRIVERIEPGRTYLDGTRLIGALDGIVRARIKMALNGHVIVTLVLDEDDRPIGDAWCDLSGLAEVGASGTALQELLEADVTAFLGRAGRKTLADDDKLESEIRHVVRRTTLEEIGKRPEVTVIASRLA